MKKLIMILLLLISTSIFAQNFTTLDTVNVTLSSSSFTRVTLGSGVKAITVNNTANDTLWVGFSNGTTADTTNTYPILAYEQYTFVNRINSYMYLKNGATSTIPVIIDYGAGIPFYTYPKLLTLYLIDTSIVNAYMYDSFAVYNAGLNALIDSIYNYMPKSDSTRFHRLNIDSLSHDNNDTLFLNADNNVILNNAREGDFISLDSSLEDGTEIKVMLLTATFPTIIVNNGLSQLIYDIVRAEFASSFIPSKTFVYCVIRNGIWYIREY